ncbi:expressed unknown protein [Seminavis robusta]|uniref:Uncharacterized protein n=1 Tax=Seminavis robusta TaxID=568900 RepID=A0A9N8ED12_9STRA|nr:expressed unknown protein [Seminavis robusta]|eukprot:Sro969_g226250.1 n/a (516) ;mRNA; r:28799-30435
MIANKTILTKAEALVWWYRPCFAVALLTVLTIATLSNLQEVETDLLLVTNIRSVQIEIVRSSSIDLNSSRSDDLRQSRDKEMIQRHDEVTEEHQREVYFLNRTHLSISDGFSASWLQTRSTFTKMPFHLIHICEDAAIRSYDKRRRHRMRMTLDWMDFSVEHMSKWWKMLEWHNPHQPIPYQRITQQFTEYIQKDANMSQIQIDNTFQQTIAVIAFQAYHNKRHPSKAHDLTMKSLAATIESLRRAGFGRVTVGILAEADYNLVQDTFQFLLQMLEPTKPHDPKELVKQIGHMEVGIAFGSSEHAKTKHESQNMPRATLLGLRDSFRYSEMTEGKRTNEMTSNMTAWLGNQRKPSFWQYVYLTEPDTILQARPSALPQLRAEVDMGSVLLPHRLQPIPHESDLRGMDREDLYVAEHDFPKVIGLDPNHHGDACCDEYIGKESRPGTLPHHRECKKQFWYQCGFGKKELEMENRHARLKPYKFIRLLGGTGIVSLAGSEHGRMCIPRKNGICRPPG